MCTERVESGGAGRGHVQQQQRDGRHRDYEGTPKDLRTQNLEYISGPSLRMESCLPFNYVSHSFFVEPCGEMPASYF